MTRLLPLVLLGQFLLGSADAQQPNRPPNLGLGDAVVTGFSGTTAPTPGQPLPANKSAVDLTFINPDGPSARIVGVGRPGYVWDGRLFQAPKTFDVFAKDVGQVFGVALDDQVAPNIYLAATSAFGLQLVGRGRDGLPERRKTGGPGAGWMKGQFGLDLQGDPGSIYKVDGTTGVVSLFAKVLLEGVPNPGPALGNLAYDAAHKQLFVSALDTGMIHRFAIGDGSESGPPFDHGVSGRPAANQAPVPFNPANRANIANARFNSENPDTWGFAPPTRRVWGLAVHDGRLYYSARNGSPTNGPQIFSVGIQQDGSFGSDARFELDVAGAPYPVSDIAFSQKGAMILAQRAPAAGSYDYSAFTAPGEPRVLRYWLKDRNDPPSPGLWKPAAEEYAVGFAGTYRNTDGGVALGYGYGQDGMLSTGACEAALWTTGQNLRNNPALRSQLEPGGPLVVHGLQGSPIDMVRGANEPPATAYFIDYDDKFDDAGASGHMGSVRILAQPCVGAVAASGASGAPGATTNPPYVSGPTTPTSGDCPAGRNPDGTCGVVRIDLAIKKTASQGKYDPATGTWTFTFTLAVTNVGNPFVPANHIVVADPVPNGLTFTAAAGTNWNCPPAQFPVTTPNALNCTYNFGPGQIATGATLAPLVITVTVKNAGKYENCATTGISGAPWLQETTQQNNKDCTTIVVPVDLAIKKTAGEVKFDEKTGTWSYQYTLTITNVGAANNGPIQISDPVPAGLTFTSYNAAGWTCALSTALTCTHPGPIAHNQTFTITITVTTKTPGKWENCATVGVTPASGLQETTLANNKDCVTVEAKYPPNNVTVVKTNPPGGCAAGAPCTFTFTVTNNSPWPFNGQVSVADNAGIPMTISSTTLPCNPQPTAIPFTCTAQLSMPAGPTSQSFTVTAWYPQGAIPLSLPAQSFQNCVSIDPAPPVSGFPSTISASGKDCKPYVACGFQCHMKQDQIDQIKIEKKANTTQCSPGGLCSYTFTISNLSTTAPTSYFPIAFLDTMPAGSVFQPPPVPAPWSCIPFGNPGEIKCLYPPSSIPAGGSLTVTVTFQIPPNYSSPTLSNCSEFFVGQAAMAAAQRRSDTTIDATALRSYLQSRGVSALPATASTPVLHPDDKSCTTVNIVHAAGMQLLTCAPPMIPGPVAGQCICPPGTVQRGSECVRQETCLPPMVPGPVAGQCICPPGTVQRGRECVKQETCPPPKVPGPVAGQCICPPGSHPVGDTCEGPPPPACKPPMIPGPVAGRCICPPGTVQRGRECVKQPACQPPMVAGPIPGQCICPQGMVQQGRRCVPRVICRPPQIPNAAGTACACPPGTVQRGRTCEQPKVCNPPARLNRLGQCECPQDMIARGNSCIARERPSPGIIITPRGGRDTPVGPRGPGQGESPGGPRGQGQGESPGRR